MTNTRKRVVAGVALCAGLALGIAGSLRAQTFQSVYGGQSNDAARGGTIHTSDGGIITVGESQSFGVGTYDAYVVKTDCCGNLQWAATYDIGNGGDDYGRKIREAVDGNFVIVGSTTNNKPCCFRKGADVFVLNIDPSGNVNWLNTYGGAWDDQGTNIELFNGGKEYIVSGRTASFGAGDYDGYLLRIDFNGGLIWARAYGGGAYDSFNSLWAAQNGDILATGETYSYSGGMDNDIWIVRVGQDGDCGGKTFWSYHYGSPKSNEAANDIVEDDKTLITVVGYTNIISGTPDPYILKVDGNGHCFCDNTFLNAKDGTRDAFNEVISLGSANNLDVVAVGTNTSPAFGFGSSDVLLTRIDVKCNPVRFWHYGTTKVEEGHSIDVVYCNPDDPAPTQYIMAGVTNSCCFGGEDMYLIRADATTYSSCCNDQEIKMQQKAPGFCEQRAPTCCPLILVWCELKTEPVYNKSWKPLCQCCDKPVCGCFVPNNQPGIDQEHEHLGANPDRNRGNNVDVPAAPAATTVTTRRLNNHR